MWEMFIEVFAAIFIGFLVLAGIYICILASGAPFPPYPPDEINNNKKKDT
jgi:hypothetical protein